MKKIAYKQRYRQALVEYAMKHGVTKAAIRYNETRQLIYRWMKRKTLFEQTLDDFGIRHKLIRPFTPRHNGKVERSHRKDNKS